MAAAGTVAEAREGKARRTGTAAAMRPMAMDPITGDGRTRAPAPGRRAREVPDRTASGGGGGGAAGGVEAVEPVVAVAAAAAAGPGRRARRALPDARGRLDRSKRRILRSRQGVPSGRPRAALMPCRGLR